LRLLHLGGGGGLLIQCQSASKLLISNFFDRSVEQEREIALSLTQRRGTRAKRLVTVDLVLLVEEQASL
jgi:hypothetical protein